MNQFNKIIQGDTLEVLKTFPDESIDMSITSPPYWGLRDYGVDSQLGLEPDFNDFLKKMWAIYDEIKRCLKKDGTIWVNFGDSYYTKSGSGEIYGGLENKPDKNYGVSEHRQNIRGGSLLPTKCICMIPERFALGMIDRGWILRNKIIWHKPNHMPSSVKDRFANSWEYVFFFSKSKKYYFDLDAVREPHKSGNIKRSLNKGRSGFRIDEIKKEQNKGTSQAGNSPLGKNPGDIIQSPYAVQSRLKDIIEYRNLPDIDEFSLWLNIWRKEQKITIDVIESKMESKSPHHWFSGEAYPKVEDWKIFKELYNPPTLYDKQLLEVFTKSSKKINNPLGKNPSDYWLICPQPFPEAHFAVFPEKLIEKPIMITRKGSLILDPFMGSGTTAVVAKKLGRNYVGIELNPKYIEIAKKRLNKVPVRLDMIIKEMKNCKHEWKHNTTGLSKTTGLSWTRVCHTCGLEELEEKL